MVNVWGEEESDESMVDQFGVRESIVDMYYFILLSYCEHVR